MTHGILTVVLALGSMFFGAGAGAAATIENTGTSPVVLVIVEDGSKTELSLDAGGSDTICPSGCFLTLPNGDRIGLAGNEAVEIRDGVATIK